MSGGIGANALNQLICFLSCLGFGCCGGVFCLLYLRKASFFERILTDFFATVCMGGVFLLSLDVAMCGKMCFYGIAGYILGVVFVLFLGKLAYRNTSNRKRNKKNK